MIETEKLQKGGPPKRFYFITALIFLPIFYCLAIIRASWFGYVLAVFSFGMLLRMRSTKLWRGLRMAACFATAFVVALAGLYVSRPQKDVSLAGQISRETLRFVLSLPVPESVRSGEGLAEISAWKASEGYDWQTIRLRNCSLELLSPKEGENSRALLQLHGGAFVSGMNDLYRTFAERYSVLLGGGTVATLDYRLFPDYGFPCQQDDVMDAWRYLTHTLGFAPENVVVAGDSAGGNLALSLCLRLRDAGEPLPGAVVCMSPWGDLSNSGPSHVFNATLDPTFGIPEAEFYGQAVGVPSEYAAGLNAEAPYLSPSFGEYAGFPRMLLQVSSNEVLLSDSETVAENARQNGVDCTLTVYQDMFHVFQGSLDLLPESRQAWSEIGTFLAAQ